MSGNEGAAAVEVAAQAFAGYVPPAVAAGTRWFLDANEGKPGRFVVEALAATDAVEAIRRYPRATALEADIERAAGDGERGAGEAECGAGSGDCLATRGVGAGDGGFGRRDREGLQGLSRKG